MSFIRGFGSGAQKLPDDDNVEKKGGGFFKRLKPQSKTDGLLSGATEHDKETITNDPAAAKTNEVQKNKLFNYEATVFSPSDPDNPSLAKKPAPQDSSHKKITNAAAGSLGIKKSPSSDSTSSGSTLSSSHSVEDDDEEEDVKVNLKQHAVKTDEASSEMREIIRKNTKAPPIGGDLYDKFGKLTLLVDTKDNKTFAEIKNNFVQYIDQYIEFADARITESFKNNLKETLYGRESFKELYVSTIKHNYSDSRHTYLASLTSYSMNFWINFVVNSINQAGGKDAFDSPQDQEVIEGLSKNASSWIEAMKGYENKNFL